MAGSNLWDFLSHFQTGFAQRSKYRVEFTLPPGVNLATGTIGVNTESTQGNIRQIENSFNAKGGINIKCHSMTFPQRSLMTYEHKQNSAPFRIPYSSVYDPTTFSFYANAQLDTRDYFDIWQAAVVNVGTNTINFYDEYVSDIKLWALDAQGKDSYGVVLYEAWPLNVGQLDYGYAESNTLQTTSVTMSYKSWQPIFNNSGVQRTT
jgi:hypothetical protein